jgi:hypothetical protein
MKKSQKIVLTLIASACIMASACSSDQKTKRNVYASKAACADDWGGSECEPTSTGSDYHGPHYYYSGGRQMYYPMGHDAPVETRPSQGAYTMKSGMHSANAVSSFTSSKTSRGGFGHSSSSHSGGS